MRKLLFFILVILIFSCHVAMGEEEVVQGRKYTSGLGENQYSGEAIAVVSDGGIACAFFAVGPLEYESYYSKILNDLAGSLGFSSIEQESEVP